MAKGQNTRERQPYVVDIPFVPSSTADGTWPLKEVVYSSSSRGATSRAIARKIIRVGPSMNYLDQWGGAETYAFPVDTNIVDERTGQRLKGNQLGNAQVVSMAETIAGNLEKRTGRPFTPEMQVERARRYIAFYEADKARAQEIASERANR